MRKAARIYTITANPALDLSGHVAKILPDEKNYVQDARFDPGGNAINAARIIKRLGGDPTLLGFLGGAAGDQIKALLEREGLTQRFTKIHGSTRTNVTVTNEADHHQTRLTFPGPRVSQTEIAALHYIIKKLSPPGIIIIGGTPPGTSHKNFYTDLIRVALKTKLGVIVDVPAKELKVILGAKLGKLLLIKPNQVELESLLERTFSYDVDIAKAACELLPRSELVCVSLAERGAILAFHRQAWLIQSPPVHARGTVGAGDSMVGAITVKLAKLGITCPDQCQKSDGILEALKWGVAAGAATATTLGTSLGKASLIRSLFPKASVQKIWDEESK